MRPGTRMRVHHHIYTILTENDFGRGTIEPEVLRSAQKPVEVCNGMVQLGEETYIELLEEWRGDPRKKCFQESANTLESDLAEVRKCGARHDWRTERLSLSVTDGIIGVKGDAKYLQLRYE